MSFVLFDFLASCDVLTFAPFAFLFTSSCSLTLPYSIVRFVVAANDMMNCIIIVELVVADHIIVVEVFVVDLEVLMELDMVVGCCCSGCCYGGLGLYGGFFSHIALLIFIALWLRIWMRLLV